MEERHAEGGRNPVNERVEIQRISEMHISNARPAMGNVAGVPNSYPFFIIILLRKLPNSYPDISSFARVSKSYKRNSLQLYVCYVLLEELNFTRALIFTCNYARR